MGNIRARIRVRSWAMALTLSVALTMSVLVPAPAQAAAAPTTTTVSGTVSGHTTTGTAPLAGVRVRVFNGTTTKSALSVAGGKFTVTGLTAGRYQISYERSGTSGGATFANRYWPNKPTLAQAQAVTVGTAKLTGYNATLQQGGTISGILTSKAGLRLIPATTVRKVTTYLDGSKTGVEHVIAVDWAGRYTLTGLAAGTYKLSFGDVKATTGLKGEYYNNATTLAASKPVVLGFAKNVTGIDAELAGEPVLIPSGTVSGSPTVGSVLTVSVFFNPTAETVKYQWYRNGVSITGATKATYQLAGVDSGKAIAVTAKGSTSGYTPGTGTFTAPSTIVPGTFVADQPAISGTAKVGATLTAIPGTTTPTPTALTYGWFRSGVAIPGATAKTYKISSVDKGATLTVRVTAKAPGYTTMTLGSLPTVAVPKN